MVRVACLLEFAINNVILIYMAQKVLNMYVLIKLANLVSRV